MPDRLSLLLFACLLLAGCNSAEEKILDLSAGVFLIFVLLVVVKYVSPSIVRSSQFVAFLGLIEQHCIVIVWFLFATAVLLIAYGLFMAGIGRIQIFTGFVVVVIAVHLRALANPGSEGKRKRSVEIISLGFGVIFALTSLWYFGVGLFRGL